MSRDYVAEIKARQAELAALPDRYHQVIALHGQPLQICRTTRIGQTGAMEYTYRLAYDCPATPRREAVLDSWDHQTVLESTATSDQKACRQFVQDLHRLAHLIGTVASRENLLRQAAWYDTHPNERDD